MTDPDKGAAALTREGAIMAEKRTAGATRAKRGEEATQDRKPRPSQGPVEWLFPRLEETYMRLGPKEDVEPALQRPRRSAARSAAARAVAAAAETIRHDERLLYGKVEGVSRNYWEEVLGEYHRRRLARGAPRLAPALGLLT